jgi:hypothetical protein
MIFLIILKVKLEIPTRKIESPQAAKEKSA